MKKIWSIILMLALVLSLTGCQKTSETSASSDNGASAEDDTITIGIYQPLTGASSLMGNAGNNAAVMAAEEINAAGGILGKQVEIVSYDDQSVPEEAVKIVNKMLEVDHVDAIIGSLHSGNIQAVGDIVEEAGIPMMGPGTSPQWLQKGWTYLFRPTLSTYYSVYSLIEVCDTLDIKNIAIFHSQDEYGKNCKDTMVEICAENNIDVLDVESMKPGDSDYTAQVANIKKANPDAVYILATTDNLPAMVKQTRAGGVDTYIIGDVSLGAPEVKEIAGASADDIIYGACLVMPKDDPEEAGFENAIQFFENYRDRWGIMCESEVALRVYDGMYLLKEGFERAGTTDGEAVRDAIYSIEDYEGLQGTFDFAASHDGEGLTQARLFIIKDGQDVLLEDWLEEQ